MSEVSLEVQVIRVQIGANERMIEDLDTTGLTSKSVGADEIINRSACEFILAMVELTWC